MSEVQVDDIKGPEALSGMEKLLESLDAAPCEGVTLDDLDSTRMIRLIRTARGNRQFPLDENTPPEDLLRHLNLLNKGRLTNRLRKNP